MAAGAAQLGHTPRTSLAAVSRHRPLVGAIEAMGQNGSVSDEQDQAEGLDDDRLLDEEQPGDGNPYDDVPAEDYPPDRPQGVEDIGVDEMEDDLVTRTDREEPEQVPGEDGRAVPVEDDIAPDGLAPVITNTDGADGAPTG